MRNFVNIKNVFNRVLVESMRGKDNQKRFIFKEYYKTIKNSDVLKTQFIVLNNIETKYFDDPYLAGEYVKECINAFKKFDRKTIIEENKKLESLSEKHGLSVKEEKYDLYESLVNLVLLESNVRNIDTIQDSFQFLRNYLLLPKQNINKNTNKLDESKFIPPSLLATILSSRFNSKYSSLSESDKKLLKRCLSENDEDKKSVFEDLINESIKIIDSKLNSGDSEVDEKLNKSKEKLLSMTYKSESFISDISRIYSLKTGLEK